MEMGSTGLASVYLITIKRSIKVGNYIIFTYDRFIGTAIVFELFSNKFPKFRCTAKTMIDKIEI